MNLSKRSLLVITPVVLLSFVVASLVVYEESQKFVERQEQNRVTYAVNQLAAIFSQYTTFNESYLRSITESTAFHQFLSADGDSRSELALVDNIEQSVRSFIQYHSDFLSIVVASNSPQPEIIYYLELSSDPLHEISEPLSNFALALFEGSEHQKRGYLAPSNEPNTIVNAQLLDRYTLVSALSDQTDGSIVVQLAIEPTEFNQLRAELQEELGAEFQIVNTAPPITGLMAFTELEPNQFLLATLPPDHLQKQLRPLAVRLAVISFLFSLMASICLYGLIRHYLTKPVSRLEQDLSDVMAKRSTSLPTREHGNDEINRLARAFRSLYDNLAQSYNDTRHLMEHDSLTGLHNLSYISQQAVSVFKEADASGDEVALLYLDLDNFKYVNVKYGHKFGDDLLVSFAGHLLAIVAAKASAPLETPPMILTGRVAGDQFCLLVRHPTALVIIRDIAQRVLDELAEGMRFEHGRIPFTVSMGIAVYPNDANSVSQLISNADTAMYQAKLQGKNQIAAYSSDLAIALRRRQEIETELKSVKPDEEFKLVYMPLLNVHTDELDGFEALLRWESPRLGNIDPDEFVPIAEACGVYALIDEWVIRTGLSTYPTMRAMLGRDFKISLNISSAQLLLSNLTDVLDHYAKRYDIEPKYIQLEITETVNIDYTPHAREFLNSLSKRGYLLALDDFGAGFTSLLRMVEYPIDMVKFDKRFIQETLKHGNRQVLKPLVELCHSNGMLVTMEGAETQEDIDLLRSFDCDYIQGYFLGRPISLASMEETLRELRRG